MIVKCKRSVDKAVRYRNLFLVGTALAGTALLPSVAKAQSAWGGAGSSTSTSDYNLGTNWSTSPVAPTAAGSSAQFNNTGFASVAVTAGPITPDSWTFTSNSQSYTVTGAAVNFSNGATLTNNANAGQAISIANNMTGTALSQTDFSTLTLSGTNSFTNTSVSGGTLANFGSLTSTVGVSGGGTFSNNLTVTGAVSNAGTFNNNAAGTVSGLLTNTAGFTTNNGQLNGGANVTDGFLTNNLTITGAVSNAGIFINNALGTVSGLLTNTAGITNNNGQLNGGANITDGILTNSLTITGAVSNAGNFINNSNGTVSGLLINTTGVTTNNGQLNGGANITGGILTNNLTITGAVSNAGIFTNNVNGTVSGLLTNTAGITINDGELKSGANVTGGILSNNLTITGAVSNAGSFANNGTVSGLLTNTAGSAGNDGQLNGGVSVSGGIVSNYGNVIGGVTVSGIGTYAQNAGVTSGGVTNSDVVLGSGGAINGAISNNAGGTFVIIGTVTSDSTFNNAATNSFLRVFNGGAYTVAGLVTNSSNVAGSGILIDPGSTLTATAGGIANNAGATIVNNGIVNGALNNAGTVTNNLTWTGAVSTGGTFNNNASGTVSGLLTNTAGITTNSGQLNGGVAVSGGTVSNSNVGGGGVTVSGTGIYTQTAGTTGGGLINGNIVNANGGAINGAISNNAGGTFNVGGTATSDSTFNNAAASSVLHITNGGAYTVTGLVTNSGNAAGGGILVDAGGSLTATTGGITNNAGATIVNNGIVNDALNNAGTVNNNKTWTGTVFNGGTFNNNAAGTVSGLLTNTAGTTNNDGTLSAGATVNGGTLTGQGLITGATTVASGGTFAPGNGTAGTAMTLAGSLALQSGAFYMVQINRTSSLANVSGNAILNGATVKANFTAGSYVTKQSLFLHATSGVTGTFNPTVTNANLPSNFKTSLSYDPNGKDVHLDLALSFMPPSGSLKGDQQNVAKAVTGFFNSTGGVPLVFGGLGPAGLTQVSGETATGSQQTTFNAMGQFIGVMTDPFIAGRSDGIAEGPGATSFAEENDAAKAYAGIDPPRGKSEREAYGVWAAGFGGSQTTAGNATLGSNDTSSRLGAVAVGADYRFSPNTIAGFALAGGGTGFDVANGGTGRSDLFQAGGFVRHTVGPAYLAAALAYGWQDITTDRTVTMAGIDRLRAEFTANAWSGRLEGGYRFAAPGLAFGLTPYAAAQFTTFDLPAYAEKAIAGANTFALAYGARNVTATRSELGFRADQSFAMTDGVFTLRGRAAWAHDYNPDRIIGATFQTLPGASFVVNGATQANEAALVTASAEMKWLNGWSAAGTFEGEFSKVTRSYAGKGVVRYQW